jgi:hypothetical protein
MATEVPVLSLTKAIQATMASSQHYGVYANSSNQWQVAATKGRRISGVMQENPATGNAEAMVSGLSKAVAGGAIDEGDPITVDSSGRFITANDAADYVIGEAMSAVSAAGSTFSLLITHAGYLGSTSAARKAVKVDFTGMAAADDPVLQDQDGTVAGGGDGTLCTCDMPDGTRLAYFPIGTQTILGPVGAALGIDIGCDQTDNEGLDLFSNMMLADGRPIAVGIDGAFYFQTTVTIQTINGCDDLFIGFITAETAQANMEDYNTFFGLGINTAATPGLLKVREELAGAGAVNTSTTDTIASATALQVRVMVSGAGVATVTHDAASTGTLAAPTVTSTFTFNDGQMVVPHIRFLNANAAQAGTFVVSEWDVGFQD